MDLLGFDWVRFSRNLREFRGNRRKSLGKRRKIGGDYLRHRLARPPGPARRQRGPGGLTGRARALHGVMTEVFPELKHVKHTHCWEGQSGFTFDELPHIGVHDGVHYAMGYCGVGMPMGTYLGHKVGLKVLGKPEGKTPFDGRPFPSRPYYWAKPWFLPFVIGYFNVMDWWDRVRG
jgi:glycine/D-amino acid oxidase-like deaminating enzyme